MMEKYSIEEKRQQFFILLGLFLLAISIFGYVIFSTKAETFFISKDNLELRIQEDLKFEDVALVSLKFIDSVSNQISRFDPAIQAVFLETDIKRTINDLNAIYVMNDFDNRYTVFGQSALLYDNYFVDRRELKGDLMDVDKIQKSLNDCLLQKNQLQSILNERAF